MRAVGGAAIAAPFYQLLANPEAHALDGVARRLIVFYFPDGIPGPSESGDPSLWHASGSEYNFTLPSLLDPIARFKDRSLFFDGVDMGRADEGSHPGGAKKLLTGVDGGGGESIDQFLARTVGANKPHRHIYLGCQANNNGASGDKHISYVAPNTSVPPEDNPQRAFDRYFPNGQAIGQPGGMTGNTPMVDRRERSVIDGALADMNELRAKLGGVEQTKLDLHLEALREVERRVATLETMTEEPPQPMSTCQEPRLDSTGYDDTRLYEPEMFPKTLQMQIDVMVQAMACGLSSVGVLQASFHTSELIMSRFMGSDLYDPGFDMRSHQASHYGPNHDQGKREFRDYVAQRKWFLQQFAYLLEQLDARPEGEGTMLDHSLVLLCSEVCDGNTHSHSNMPFLLAGSGAGAVKTGRLLKYTNNDRHSNLFVALAQAMGSNINNFGQGSYGPLYNVLA